MFVKGGRPSKCLLNNTFILCSEYANNVSLHVFLRVNNYNLNELISATHNKLYTANVCICSQYSLMWAQKGHFQVPSPKTVGMLRGALPNSFTNIIRRVSDAMHIMLSINCIWNWVAINNMFLIKMEKGSGAKIQQIRCISLKDQAICVLDAHCSRKHIITFPPVLATDFHPFIA